MNKHISETDLAAPKVTTGPLSGSRKIYARPEAAPDLRVPLREIPLTEAANAPPQCRSTTKVRVLWNCTRRKRPISSTVDCGLLQRGMGK